MICVDEVCTAASSCCSDVLVVEQHSVVLNAAGQNTRGNDTSDDEDTLLVMRSWHTLVDALAEEDKGRLDQVRVLLICGRVASLSVMD